MSGASTIELDYLTLGRSPCWISPAFVVLDRRLLMASRCQLARDT